MPHERLSVDADCLDLMHNTAFMVSPRDRNKGLS